TLRTGSPFIGLAAGLSISMILGGVHWLLTQIYRIDAIISGMGLNAVVLGGCNYLSQKLILPTDSDKIATLPISLYIVLAVLLPLFLMLYS
ncbi:hypothetical protein ACSTHN_00190, partial [Vibrio parahaemolyticus]